MNLETWNYLFWNIYYPNLSSSHPMGLPRHRQPSIEPGTNRAVAFACVCVYRQLSELYLYIYMYVYIYIYIIYISYIYKWTHLLICTYIHTYIHTYIYILNNLPVYIFRFNKLSLYTHVYLKTPLYFWTCVSPGFLWSFSLVNHHFVCIRLQCRYRKWLEHGTIHLAQINLNVTHSKCESC